MEAVIDKIRKLSALAQAAGTEHEAAAAMGRIQALLTKHNLDMADVGHADDKDLFVDETAGDKSVRQKWERNIYASISSLYFCNMYYCGPRVHIVGRPVNVETVRYVASVVIAAGKRAAKAFGAEYVPSYYGTKTKAVADFKLGFAQRVHRRSLDMIEESKKTVAETHNGSSIVVADYYREERERVSDFISGKGLRLRETRQRRANVQPGAFIAGQGAANGINLRANGISGRGTGFLLGAA